MSRLAKDPKRKVFVKSEGYETWQCWDYKTFYMTVRRQDMETDKKYKRDKNKYLLYMSSTEIFENIDTPELAMKKGYERADEIFDIRLKSSPMNI